MGGMKKGGGAEQQVRTGQWRCYEVGKGKEGKRESKKDWSVRIRRTTNGGGGRGSHSSLFLSPSYYYFIESLPPTASPSELIITMPLSLALDYD
jgi:hypothetical protein